MFSLTGLCSDKFLNPKCSIATYNKLNNNNNQFDESIDFLKKEKDEISSDSCQSECNSTQLQIDSDPPEINNNDENYVVPEINLNTSTSIISSCVNNTVIDYSSKSMPPMDIERGQQIMECIAKLRQRKARPDKEHIILMMKKFYLAEEKETIRYLDQLLQQGQIVHIDYKGKLSYRIASIFKRRSKLNPPYFGSTQIQNSQSVSRSLVSSLIKKIRFELNQVRNDSTKSNAMDNQENVIAIPDLDIMKFMKSRAFTHAEIFDLLKDQMNLDSTRLNLMLERECLHGSLVKRDNNFYLDVDIEKVTAKRLKPSAPSPQSHNHNSTFDSKNHFSSTENFKPILPAPSPNVQHILPKSEMITPQQSFFLKIPTINNCKNIAIASTSDSLEASGYSANSTNLSYANGCDLSAFTCNNKIISSKQCLNSTTTTTNNNNNTISLPISSSISIPSVNAFVASLLNNSTSNNLSITQALQVAAPISTHIHTLNNQTNILPKNVCGIQPTSINLLPGSMTGYLGNMASLFNPTCSVCHDKSVPEKKIYSCSSCNTKSHLGCLGFWVSEPMEPATWQCPNCISCRICRRRDVNDRLLVCATCTRAYHALCHVPKVPDNMELFQPWVCQPCDNQGYYFIPHDASTSLNATSSNCMSTSQSTVNITNVVSSSKIPINPVLPNTILSSILPKVEATENPISDVINLTDNEEDNLNHESNNNCNTITEDYSINQKSETGSNKFSFLEELSGKKQSFSSPENLRESEVENWSVNDVSEWLSAEGFRKEAKLFSDQEIDGSSLLLMRKLELLSQIGLKLGPAVKIMQLLKRIPTK